MGLFFNLFNVFIFLFICLNRGLRELISFLFVLVVDMFFVVLESKWSLSWFLSVFIWWFKVDGVIFNLVEVFVKFCFCVIVRKVCRLFILLIFIDEKNLVVYLDYVY